MNPNYTAVVLTERYCDEFRPQAVDLYESSAGATVRGIAEDLGVERGTLRHWLNVYGTERARLEQG
jgi:transposase